MSGLEESALIIAGLSLASVIGKRLLTKYSHKCLKKSIQKTLETGVKTAEFIYKELQNVGLTPEHLPEVQEIISKLEEVKNSELGSKPQKSKIVNRLLKRLEGEITDKMTEMVEEHKKQILEDKRLKEQADKIKEMIKQGADVSQIALDVAKSFTPQEEDITPEQKHLNKIRARLRGGRRR